jgi:tRNA acetyltransferase TAN1
LFGIRADAEGTSDDQEPEDIEAAIEKELAAMRASNRPKDAPFDLLRMNVDCVLFVRTRTPVDPLLLVRDICEDAAAVTDKSQWRSRFINKLTPVSLIAKATEKGLEELVEKILPSHFQLAAGETEATDSGGDRVCSVSALPLSDTSHIITCCPQRLILQVLKA